MVRVRIPQIGLVATAAALAVVVTGCGNGTNSAQPQPQTQTQTVTATAPGGSTPSQEPDATGPASSGAVSGQSIGNNLCKSSELKLSLGRGDAAAGTVYRPLIFTNTGDHQCVLQGFPGVSYVGGDDGHQIGAPASRNGAKGAAVTLNKGESAFADVGLVNVQNYDAATCRPEQARGLRVYPPQETQSMFIDLPSTACANPGIPGNQLTVKTLEKGTGPQ
ncbi:DUF4232 domain-containing protein [Amycolatopsis cynarae]|uniref:DUF4232 domain-containing protein n=2 Tax=Amycolatopsis cynarae TaxID=2995223 RepID=A0ABY7BC27_9PSEU|nr:DUF4232 domain-containing protein [Amycolatopsis sp. HUAS 11-8]